MHPRIFIAVLVSLLCSSTLAVPIQLEGSNDVASKGKGNIPEWMLQAQPSTSSLPFSAKLSVLSGGFGFYTQQSARHDIFEARALEDPIFLSVRIASMVESGGEGVRNTILQYADSLRRHGITHQLEPQNYMDITSVSLSSSS
ncbi:hypothetical protein BDN72DRAFT_904758 [Pluteus cervinus]|uniref:Uncharacterized protein n=1 Tax=Pluteus cervinus TaxID=181527 RepID=A0ACD3A4T1_9AGAR|nr:hypothetical protein BDN72DRAFT_904758 [Pluteus cervinus]